MIGCVGDDEEGKQYIEALRVSGIETGGIKIADGQPTGRAIISVDPEGENTIIVEPGANTAVTPERIESCAGKIKTADVLLVQLECPFHAVRRACEIARENGSHWN